MKETIAYKVTPMSAPRLPEIPTYGEEDLAFCIRLFQGVVDPLPNKTSLEKSDIIR